MNVRVIGGHPHILFFHGYNHMMLQACRIGFIGGGVMCEAMIRGMLKANVATCSLITASDPLAHRRLDLQNRYGIITTSDNAVAAAGADVIVLAVKPQQANIVLRELRTVVLPSTLTISIMAGVTINTLASAIGDAQPIVRVMPNTPAQIGEGASGWTATSTVNAEQRKQTESMLSALGKHAYFENEHYIDMVTGVSGSGPAFVFLFIEAFMDAAVRIGIPRPIAEMLVLQTVKGSALYLEQSAAHPAVLRNQVTSAGGTTAAGLHELEAGAFRATIEHAVEAAFLKSEALGRQS